VEALVAGKIVALPTETVYGIAASALNEEAVRRLADVKGRDPSKPFAFAVKSHDDALDYVPDMSVLARRIARRCWPGPVTLVVPHRHPDSVIQRLPEIVQQCSVPGGTVGLRVPAHEVTLEIMRLTPGPLVLTSANHSGQPDATDGAQVIDYLGDEIDLILDDGPSRFGQSSSVVKVDDNDFTFLREGVIDAPTLKQMTSFIVLIACTGNTCRSPMGEALMKQHLAGKLDCSIDELPDKGVRVVSAGIHAMSGAMASPQAVEVMRESGLDISSHASQPVTEHLLQFADVVLTMTNGHKQAIVSRFPTAAPRVKTVRFDGGDVNDPIGSPVESYRACAKQIDENLAQWAAQFDLKS
ncbi:MAG: L-threonylcarbamoyladenylate synthase, partial [Planctomycetota bacterium]